jgi:hypothetical protein
MEQTPQERHEQMRQQVWSNAWTATANANDCKDSKVATGWADKALAAFDVRFPAPKTETK